MFWRSSNFWADLFSGFFILCFSSFLTVSCKKRNWQEKRHSEQLLSNHCSLQCRTVVAKFFTSGTNCIFLAFSRRYTVDGSPLHDASRGSLVLHSILSSPDPVTMTCTQLPVAFWAQHACIRLASTFITPSVFTQLKALDPDYHKNFGFFHSSSSYNGWLQASYQCW